MQLKVLAADVAMEEKVVDPRVEPRTGRYFSHNIMGAVTALVAVELFLLTSKKS